MLGLRAYLLLALVAAVPLAYGAGRWRGYQRGVAAEVVAQAKEAESLRGRLAVAELAVDAKAAEIAAWEEAQRMLAREIEDEVQADPGASRRVPSADSLLRLRRRWASGG